MSSINNIQTLNLRSSCTIEELVHEEFECTSLGTLCAMGFLDVLSKMPEGLGSGRSIRNDDLGRFFLDFCKLTEWDIDLGEFHYLLNCWIDDGSIPLTLILMENGLYEEIGGIDLELLGKLFEK